MGGGRASPGGAAVDGGVPLSPCRSEVQEPRKPCRRDRRPLRRARYPSCPPLARTSGSPHSPRRHPRDRTGARVAGVVPLRTVPVSVVVPTIGRPALVESLLESLARCDPRASEIVVVDQSHTEPLARVVSKFDHIGARLVL